MGQMLGWRLSQYVGSATEEMEMDQYGVDDLGETARCPLLQAAQHRAGHTSNPEDQLRAPPACQAAGKVRWRLIPQLREKTFKEIS